LLVVGPADGFATAGIRETVTDHGSAAFFTPKPVVVSAMPPFSGTEGLGVDANDPSPAVNETWPWLRGNEATDLQPLPGPMIPETNSQVLDRAQEMLWVPAAPADTLPAANGMSPATAIEALFSNEGADQLSFPTLLGNVRPENAASTPGEPSAAWAGLLALLLGAETADRKTDRRSVQTSRKM
jgi:hypothetical protein